MKVITLEIADGYADILTFTAIGRKGPVLNATTHSINMHETAKVIISENGKVSDVEPVKHGSWIVTDADDGMCEDYAGFIEFRCPECGRDFAFENGQYGWYYGDPIPWKACPMCGAKMDGERREQ